jgi:hypothetical protein
MNAQELAQKFRGKVAAAASELERQEGVAADHSGNRLDDVPHIKNCVSRARRAVLNELKQHFGKDQFSFALQVDLDHKPVGVSFKIGDGAPTIITTAFGNIVVTRLGASGSSKGVAFVYRRMPSLIFRTLGIPREIRLRSWCRCDRQLRGLDAIGRAPARANIITL